jgi:hypothetical protein
MKRSIIILVLFLFSFFPFLLQAVDFPKIVINELLPSPVGSDAEEEWIEISNPNDFEVDISSWQIKDTVGKTKTYIFPEGTKITAKGFLVLRRPITKITLNNDGDGVKLTGPDGKIVDEISYQKAEEGKSYNRTESGWIWSKNLTPGAQNINPISTPTSEQKPEKEETQKAIEEINKKELAAVEEQIRKNEPIVEEKKYFTLLIALIIAIFSGIIILILKRKLDSKIEKE